MEPGPDPQLPSPLGDQLGEPAIVQYLIDHGANVNATAPRDSTKCDLDYCCRSKELACTLSRGIIRDGDKRVATGCVAGP